MSGRSSSILLHMSELSDPSKALERNPARLAELSADKSMQHYLSSNTF